MALCGCGQVQQTQPETVNAPPTTSVVCHRFCCASKGRLPPPLTGLFAGPCRTLPHFWRGFHIFTGVFHIREPAGRDPFQVRTGRSWCRLLCSRKWLTARNPKPATYTAAAGGIDDTGLPQPLNYGIVIAVCARFKSSELGLTGKTSSSCSHDTGPVCPSTHMSERAMRATLATAQTRPSANTPHRAPTRALPRSAVR